MTRSMFLNSRIGKYLEAFWLYEVRAVLHITYKYFL